MNAMFGSTVLETAIGLCFVYLTLSGLCTVINEWISGVLNTRGKLLEKGIRQLLDNQAHPAPPARGETGSSKPSTLIRLLPE